MEYYIYVLKHPITDEIRYVGVTTNKKLNTRLGQHIYSAKYKRTTRVSKWIYSLLKLDLKPVIYLWETVNEVNWENREKYWISFFPNLTNIHEGGKGVVINRTKESIQNSVKTKQKKIVQLDLNKNLVKIWESASQAAKELGYSSESNINNVLKKRNNTGKGYYWAYYEDYINNTHIFNENKLSVNLEKLTPIYLYDINGNYIDKYRSLYYMTVKFLNKRTSYNTIKDRFLNKKIPYNNYYISTILTNNILNDIV